MSCISEKKVVKKWSLTAPTSDSGSISENFFFLLNITNVDRPYYPDICIDIDIADAVVDTGIRSITFLIGELNNYGVHLEITDKVTSDFWMLDVGITQNIFKRNLTPVVL